MNIQLPSEVQALLAWLLTGTNAVTLIGVLISSVNVIRGNSTNRKIAGSQVSLLETIGAKLSELKVIAANMQALSAQVSQVLTAFETGLTLQRESNNKLAMFIMECFNKSNLSAEAKAELQVMADQIFYDDTEKLVKALKTAKAQADNSLTEANLEIQRLTEELEKAKGNLVRAQENVKENRRVV